MGGAGEFARGLDARASAAGGGSGTFAFTVRSFEAGENAMAMDANPSPGFRSRPDYTITIEPLGQPVTVKFHDVVLASSNRAKVLREMGHPPVIYIPFEDIYFIHLERTDTHTHCPFKGDATYWRVTGQGDAERDAMWAYEHPYDEMLEIRNHGAFYPEVVDIDAEI
jgi:uncharacterized protein (DUF427 family)